MIPMRKRAKTKPVARDTRRSKYLHDVYAFAPIHLLQVVGRQFVDFRVAGDIGELDDGLGVAAADEALHGPDAVARLGVFFGREDEGT